MPITGDLTRAIRQLKKARFGKSEAPAEDKRQSTLPEISVSDQSGPPPSNRKLPQVITILPRNEPPPDSYQPVLKGPSMDENAPDDSTDSNNMMPLTAEEHESPQHALMPDYELLPPADPSLMTARPGGFTLRGSRASSQPADLPEIVPLTGSQKIRGQITDVLNKGSNRDKKYDWKDLLGGLGLGFLKGFGRTGNLIGGLVEGIRGAADKNYAEKSRDERDLQRLTRQYEIQSGIEADQLKRRTDEANAAYAEMRPEFAQQRLDQQARAIDEEHLKNIGRMITGAYNRFAEFDPANPANADMVAAAAELGIPLPKKSANLAIEIMQDEDTGEVFNITTNKQTGAVEARQVLRNGQPLRITTKSGLARNVRNLDIKSREAIASARNKTMTGGGANVAAGIPEQSSSGISNAGLHEVLHINPTGAAKSSRTRSAGDTQRLNKALQPVADRRKEKLIDDSLERWKRLYSHEHPESPSRQQIDAARKTLEKTVYGGQW